MDPVALSVSTRGRPRSAKVRTSAVIPDSELHVLDLDWKTGPKSWLPSESIVKNHAASAAGTH